MDPIIIIIICSSNAHNSYEIVKQVKSFKITIVAPTCFVLHKPSSGSSQPALRQNYSVDIGYIHHYFKLSVLWLYFFHFRLNKICSHSTDNFK